MEKSNMFDEKDRAKILRDFNICRAIRSLMKDSSADAGFEREISDQVAKATGRSAQGFLIPDFIFATGRSYSPMSKASSSALVATEHLADQFIEGPAARTVLGRAGVTILDGLVGDISIPRGDVSEVYWIGGEGEDAQGKNPQLDSVAGTPHTCGAYVDITRKLLIQSSPSAVRLVTRLFGKACGRAVEGAAFNGTGTNGQPSGLANVQGVQASSMTPGLATKADVVEFWEKVATENCDGDAMCYIGSPAVKGLLSKTYDWQTIKNGDDVVGGVSAGSGYLCQHGECEGYPFLQSNLSGKNKLWFGDWSQLVVALWSGVDLTIDPYSLSKSGGVRVVVLQDVDILVRQPKAFVVGTALQDENGNS